MSVCRVLATNVSLLIKNSFGLYKWKDIYVYFHMERGCEIWLNVETHSKARCELTDSELSTSDWITKHADQCQVWTHFMCLLALYNLITGIYLTKKTSVNIRNPKLPEVGQLTDHHIRQLLHKLHLLGGFKTPGCNTDRHKLYYTNKGWAIYIYNIISLIQCENIYHLSSSCNTYLYP